MSQLSRNSSALHRLGVVVIGRNESAHVRDCLTSVAEWGVPVVYSDSGSTDDSCDVARRAGVFVVEVREGRMSAARGRREGLQELLRLAPQTEFVQFVDGDCEMSADWILPAIELMLSDPRIGAVAGKLEEKEATKSLLGKIIAIDWELPVGEVDVIGGISLMRVRALIEAGDWNDNLIAGEELDLSMRIRAAGYRIIRMDALMCVHDMGITRWRDFWKRSVRTGFAYTQLWFLHFRRGPKRWGRRVLSAVLYGSVIPAVCVFGGLVHWALPVLSLFVVAIFLFRLTYGRILAGNSVGLAAAYSLSCLVSKSANAAGVFKYLWNRINGRSSMLIEYKKPLPGKS